MITYSIGEIARRSGLRTSALRYYEQVGILTPATRINGQRRYDGAALITLTVIRMAQEAGLTIAEIGRLFNGFPTETPASERWRTIATSKLVAIDQLITQAQATRQVLVERLACTCSTLQACAATGV